MSEKKADIKVADISEPTFGEPIINTSPAVFIISNDMRNENISIFRNTSFDNFSDDAHIFTEQSQDTVQVSLDEAETIFISSKFTPRDTLRIKNGDTIYVNLKQERLSLSHDNFSNIEKLSAQDDKIDSLTQLFYYVDYEAPFNLQSDQYEKRNAIFPLRINRKNFKEASESLEILAEELVDRYKVLEKKYNALATSDPENHAYYSLLKDELNYDTFFELNRLYSYSKNKKVKDIIISEVFFNDETVHEKTLYRKLNTFIQKVILDNKKIKEKYKLKVNYAQAFDDVSNYITHQELLPLAKIVCIQNDARQKASKVTLSTYIDTFRKDIGDPQYEPFLQKIENDYGLKESLRATDAHTVALTDYKGNITNFDSFLKKHIGKVVYVDFWASWCAPCRDKIPDSKELAKSFTGKDVAFTYVSIDKNKTHWQKAVKAEKLETKTANFLATNHEIATFFKDIDMKSIPRYLLFDKTGKLIHENAPGPDSKEIRHLINKYLN